MEFLPFVMRDYKELNGVAPSQFLNLIVEYL